MLSGYPRICCVKRVFSLPCIVRPCTLIIKRSESLFRDYFISSDISEQDTMYRGCPSPLSQQQLQLMHVRKISKITIPADWASMAALRGICAPFYCFSACRSCAPLLLAASWSCSICCPNLSCTLTWHMLASAFMISSSAFFAMSIASLQSLVIGDGHRIRII